MRKPVTCLAAVIFCACESSQSSAQRSVEDAQAAFSASSTITDSIRKVMDAEHELKMARIEERQRALDSGGLRAYNAVTKRQEREDRIQDLTEARYEELRARSVAAQKVSP